jgi:hypothetical protein
MKLILNHELQQHDDGTLATLFLQVSRELARTARHSPERWNALMSLENISHARMQRMIGCPAI